MRPLTPQDPRENMSPSPFSAALVAPLNSQLVGKFAANKSVADIEGQ